MTDGQTLLAAWEQGMLRAPQHRADGVLKQLDGSDPPRSIGERNRRLLNLHISLFGDQVDLTSRCPSCDTTVQFAATCSALTSVASEAEAPSHQFDIDGSLFEFRLPEASDVTLLACCEDQHEFARRLVRRCLTGSADSELSDATADALSRRMETLDPLAVVSFHLDCPDCAATWDAPLDVGRLLWTKVQTAAERLLLEIDGLARAYGWTERDVLVLAPIRRAAYLQLAEA